MCNISVLCLGSLCSNMFHWTPLYSVKVLIPQMVALYDDFLFIIRFMHWHMHQLFSWAVHRGLTLDCTLFHLMNNQMNIFIKLLCTRKFQQTDRVQPTAPVQIQQEDLLQVTNGGWGVWMSHALVPNIVECETFLCGNIDLKIPMGSSNCCYIRDNRALMSL